MFVYISPANDDNVLLAYSVYEVLPIEFQIIAPLYLGLSLEIVVLQYSTCDLFLFLVSYG